MLQGIPLKDTNVTSLKNVPKIHSVDGFEIIKSGKILFPLQIDINVFDDAKYNIDDENEDPNTSICSSEKSSPQQIDVNNFDNAKYNMDDENEEPIICAIRFVHVNNFINLAKVYDIYLTKNKIIGGEPIKYLHSDPAEPTEPTEPAEPAELAEPIESAESAESAEPAEPTESAEPVVFCDCSLSVVIKNNNEIEYLYFDKGDYYNEMASDDGEEKWITRRLFIQHDSKIQEKHKYGAEFTENQHGKLYPCLKRLFEHA